MPLLIFLTNFVSPLWAVWELIQEKILRSQRGEKNLLYKSTPKQNARMKYLTCLFVEDPCGSDPEEYIEIDLLVILLQGTFDMLFAHPLPLGNLS